VIGVSADPPARNLAWTRELTLPFRLLSDDRPPGRVGRRWGVWDDLWSLERRVTFIVDRAGRVRWVEDGGPAIDTSRTLTALTRLARAR
jgi:peroxiredoxin